MSSRAIILSVIALFCGFVASVSVVRYVRGRNAPRPADGVPVVVAAKPLQTGTVLASSMVKVVRMPKEIAPPGAFRDPKEVVGHVLVVPLGVHEPVVHSAVGGTEGVIQAMVTAGMRAYSVQLEGEAARLASHLRVGDRVDVLWIRPSAEGEVTAKLLMQNVRVLAVGDPENKSRESTKRSYSRGTADSEVVTLEVTPEQFVLLAAAVEEGKIKLAMRRPGEKGVTDIPEVDISRLWQAPEPAEAPQMSPTVAATPVEEYVIEIIEGDNIEHQTYERVAPDYRAR